MEIICLLYCSRGFLYFVIHTMMNWPGSHSFRH